MEITIMGIMCLVFEIFRGCPFDLDYVYWEIVTRYSYLVHKCSTFLTGFWIPFDQNLKTENLTTVAKKLQILILYGFQMIL